MYIHVVSYDIRSMLGVLALLELYQDVFCSHSSMKLLYSVVCIRMCNIATILSLYEVTTTK